MGFFSNLIKKYLNEYPLNQKNFELDLNKEYSDSELLSILKYENLTVGMGNSIVLALLFRMNDRLCEIERNKK